MQAIFELGRTFFFIWPEQAWQPVLWIRIRMDPELLPGSGSGIKVPDPAKSVRAYK